MEVETLLGCSAVVGQDDIHDGGVAAVVEWVLWRRGLNELDQRADVPVGHQVVSRCAGCGLRWSCALIWDVSLVLRPVLQHTSHICDVRVRLDAVFR